MSSTTLSPLASALIGTWTLVSYHYHPTTSAEPKTYPHGPNARGLITYSVDGYMSAQVVRPGQAPFSDGGGIAPDTSGTPSDWEQVGRNFIAYSGRYWVSEEEGKEVLWHELDVCSIPRMVGMVQKRKAQLDEVDGASILNLGVDGLVLDGVDCKVEVKWKRVEDNAGTKRPET
ncbi:Lipocalin-like domain-containing protein [Paraphoma chrysanthemicola]|nr:Lipocalin-like domain-containing protein [Paraphoma chrysanthemicola]